MCGEEKGRRKFGVETEGKRKECLLENSGQEVKVKAVMFVPYTKGSKLGKELREKELLHRSGGDMTCLHHTIT